MAQKGYLPIEDYGMRIFRNPAYLRSLTPEEKALRELPQ